MTGPPGEIILIEQRPLPRTVKAHAADLLGLTPPVGMLMYIACRLTNVGIDQFVKYAWPFIAALIVVLFMVSYIPETVLFVPRVLMGTR